MTTPINGLPYPNSSSPNNPPIHFQALNNQLDTRLIPRFSTATARNNAITSPVDGMMCTVAGYPMHYRGGTWHGMVNQPYLTGAATGTTETVTTNVMTQSIADPGYPYLLYVSASVLLPVIGSDVVVHPEVRVNGSSLSPWGADIGPGGTNRIASLPSQAASTSRTGAATVTLTIVKSAGSAGNGYSTAASSVYNMLSIQVVPA